MLTYGFTYNSNPDPYSESENIQAVLVTEDGVVLSGDDTSVKSTTSDIPHGALMLRQQTDTVDSQHQALAKRLREAVDPTVIVDVGNQRSISGIVAEFISLVTDGAGHDRTGRQFVNLLGLEDETDAKSQVVGYTEETSQKTAISHNPDYVPRLISGIADVQVLQQARDARMAVLLSGEPGTGKTSLAAAAFGDELITVSCHEGMRREDLVGQWMPVANEPGSFEWKDGPLVTAMLEGRPVLLDDFGWASPEVQAALLPVADHRRTISVMDRPDEPEIVAEKGFSLVITQNPNMGVGIIDPIMSRMAFDIQVPTDLATAEDLGVDPDFLAVAYFLEEDNKTAQQQGSTSWVPSIRTLLDTTRIRTTFGAEFAASAFMAACPIDQAEYRQRVQKMVANQLGQGVIVTDGLSSQAAR